MLLLPRITNAAAPFFLATAADLNLALGFAESLTGFSCSSAYSTVTRQKQKPARDDPHSKQQGLLLLLLLLLLLRLLLLYYPSYPYPYPYSYSYSSYSSDSSDSSYSSSCYCCYCYCHCPPLLL